MKDFPKKYNPKDLYNRSSRYRERFSESDVESTVVFSPNILSGSTRLSYSDFLGLYLRDFFNYKSFMEDCCESVLWVNDLYQQLFVIYWNQIENLVAWYDFFLKRNQSLSQVWLEKLERRIVSSTKKNLKANNRILDTYFSSNHKFYMPDSELYIYILEQFRSLWNKWKITNKTQIWYRSFNLQTSIPFENLVWKEEKVPYYVLKYFVWAKWDALYVRVEWDIDICCGDVALLVHPKDKRYSKYIWKKVIIPLCNRLIPIIGDESVNIAQNGWIKRVCPCSDEESIALAKKYGLPLDVYVFDKKWMYTQYIHEEAFIWKSRSRYYNNILKFFWDIWNMAESWEFLGKVPYMANTQERLTPYKIDKIMINLEDEKQKIMNKIFNREIEYPYLNDKILSSIEENHDIEKSKMFWDSEDFFEVDTDGVDFDGLNEKEREVKQKVFDELDAFLPSELVCNSQIPFWWKVPLIRSVDWDLCFFDLEKDCQDWDVEPLQYCFDFVLLALIRAWTICIKDGFNDNNKICEYKNFYRKFCENEKKVEFLVTYLSKITWEKIEYQQFLKIIENLTYENELFFKDFTVLVENSRFLEIKWNWLYTNVKWNINDTMDSDFVWQCIICYLKSKWVNINSQSIFSKNERGKVFRELLIQELLLWYVVTKNLFEYVYKEDAEFLWSKQLTKLQFQQVQWDMFNLYWENPVRLSFLVNQTFDQKQVLVSNIFLKQVWNAVRLCIQKNFLPENIEKTLNSQPKDFEDFDIIVLCKLDELYDEWKKVETYEKYVIFFDNFKSSIQNVFFSRYLEIQKVNTTKNVQFVCAYFFNFLLNILYPLTPEFVHALQYVSNKEFINSVKSVQLNKSINYNLNILYNAFIKIKEMKLEYNIKQHEACNIFIKSNPTVCELFSQYEQIFINYFHVTDIVYLRLHEQTPLWYEIFSDDTLMIGIQPWNDIHTKDKESLENIEKEIKDLDDKLNLLRQRLPFLEWEQRKKAEEEYVNTKEGMEKLTIKYSLLSSK